MRIAVASDENYSVNQFVIQWLKDYGHEVVLFGALASNQNESWVKTGSQAAQAIEQKEADEGIFFCWTGTGISIIANRFPNIRAALCVDAQTARAARIWNHANVLVLSNRLLSQDLAQEILTAWFEEYDKSKGEAQVKELSSICK